MSLMGITQDRNLNIDWRHIALLIGIPISLAIYKTIGDKYWLETLGLSSSLVFHLGQAIIPWLITAVCTKAVMELLRRWKPSLFILTILGSFLASIFIQPYILWVSSQFYEISSLWQNGFVPLLGDAIQAAASWTVAVAAFDYLFDLHLFRYEGYKPSQLLKKSLPDPNFLSRLSPNIDMNKISAIKAEEHYIRVFTQEDNQLVLYRFSDAIAEIDDSIGQRVHRSYWASFKNVLSAEANGRKITLTMDCGLNIPVSERHQELVRQRLKENGLDVSVVGESL